MKTPPGFHELCSGLHQDAMIIADGEIEKLGVNCAGYAREDNRRDLRIFLAHVLTELSDTEHKGLLKREKTDLSFRRGSAATAFLQAALGALA